MSAGPLIRSELRSYLGDELGLEGQEFDEYMRVLSDVDSVQMSVWAERSEKASK